MSVTPSPESALLIDLCEQIRGFRKLTPEQDDKLKAIAREALNRAWSNGYAGLDIDGNSLWPEGEEAGK